MFGLLLAVLQARSENGGMFLFTPPLPTKLRSAALVGALSVFVLSCDNAVEPLAPVELEFRELVLSGLRLTDVVSDEQGRAYTADIRGQAYRVNADGTTEDMRGPIRLTSDRLMIDLDHRGHPIFGAWVKGVSILDDLEGLESWTVFDAVGDCLTSNFVTAVEGNPDGTILVGLANADGLVLVDPEAPEGPCARWDDSNSSMSLGTGANPVDGWIGGISQAREGVRWVGVREDGLHRWDDGGTASDPADDDWTAYRPGSTPALTSAGFNHIVRDPEGAVWVSTDDGLIIIRDGSWERAPDLQSPNVEHVDFGPHGFAWVSTGGGISVLDKASLEEVRRYGPGSGLPDAAVTAVAFDPAAGWAFVATEAGMAIFDSLA